MVTLCTVSAGAARLVLAPGLGGGIARLDVGSLPVLRPWAGNAAEPFTLASNVLVPFSNRISGGGINWNGQHHPVDANFAGDPYPIHGDGFQKPWEIAQHSNTATMTLPAGAIGPWRYHARQDFTLTDTGLDVALHITNTGPDTLPFGGGFHPWFPRGPQTRLSFTASGVWQENTAHLPTDHLALSDRPDWDFTKSRSLPEGWINNAFTGWHGSARITQGPDAVACMISSPMLHTAIVYSPGAQAPFFCFEPVSHPVDAVHLPGHPGLRELAPGDSLTLAMHLHWSVA